MGKDPGWQCADLGGETLIQNDAGGFLHQFLQADQTFSLNVCGGDGVNGNRQGLQILLPFPGGHQDFFNSQSVQGKSPNPMTSTNGPPHTLREHILQSPHSIDQLQINHGNRNRRF